MTPNPQDINKPKDNSSEWIRNIFKDNTSLLDEPEVKELIAEIQKAEKRGIEKAASMRTFQKFTKKAKPGRKKVCSKCGQLEADLNKIKDKND